MGSGKEHSSFVALIVVLRFVVGALAHSSINARGGSCSDERDEEMLYVCGANIHSFTLRLVDVNARMGVRV